MHRFEFNPEEVKDRAIQNIYEVSITSTLDFPNEVILKALKQGIQDYMQDHDLSAGVDYHVNFLGGGFYK